MIRTALLLLIVCGVSTAWASEDSRRPGGVAIIDVGSAALAMPAVRFNDRPVLVMRMPIAGKRLWAFPWTRRRAR